MHVCQVRDYEIYARRCTSSDMDGQPQQLIFADKREFPQKSTFSTPNQVLLTLHLIGSRSLEPCQLFLRRNYSVISLNKYS